jgi:hypothetical protein
MARRPFLKWRALPDFPAYEVSFIGQVRRRLPPKGGRSSVGYILKPGTGHLSGYHTYILKNKDGVTKGVSAHRLVALTFIGPPPSPQHEVAHNDGNPRNNHYKNLRWATRKENAEDCTKHGRRFYAKGELHWYTKLTDADVRKIRELYSQGMTYAAISRLFPISRMSCCNIVIGRTWSHVK